MKFTNLFAIGGIVAAAGLGAATLTSGPVEAQQGGKHSATPIASGDAPVVLELFTSQGCSSCPPADKLASRLAKDPSLLVISRPVTYWDRLGWKDTLGRQANTDLQRAYARKGNEGAGVYTPQIVVDGRHGAVGSRERNVTALVRDAAMKNKPKLATKKSADGTITVSVTGNLPGQARLTLLALSSSETVKIGRGENGGRTIHYTNVVMDESSLGSLSDRSRRVMIEPGQMRNRKADRYAVVLQQAGAGPIFAGKML